MNNENFTRKIMTLRFWNKTSQLEIICLSWKRVGRFALNFTEKISAFLYLIIELISRNISLEILSIFAL